MYLPIPSHVSAFVKGGAQAKHAVFILSSRTYTLCGSMPDVTAQKAQHIGPCIHLVFRAPARSSQVDQCAVRAQQITGVARRIQRVHKLLELNLVRPGAPHTDVVVLKFNHAGNAGVQEII